MVVYYSGFWLGRDKAGITEDDVGTLVDVIQYLDHKQGLDLLLHTPGGMVEPAEAMGNYLREFF